MAKSWDQMSKQERDAAGGNKKEYNKQTGQARYAVGGELENKSEANVYQPSVEPSKPNDVIQKTPERSEAKERAQGYIGPDAPGAKAGGSDSNVLRTYDDGRVHYKDGVVTADRAKYDQMEAARQKEAQAKYGNGPAPTAKEERANEAEAYRQSRLDLQAASDHSAHQIVDVSGDYKNSSNEMIQKMVDSGQKFTSVEARRALDGNDDQQLYKGAGGFEAWQDMMDNGFKSQYDQSQYITADQAKANRDQLNADRTNFYEGSGNDKYGQYDWFQKDQARFKEGPQPRSAQNKTNTRAEASDRAAAYKPPSQPLQNKLMPENSGTTNQYGDPVGTNYLGGSPTFNESTGQQESYTGADGTVTNGSNDSTSSRTISWDELQRESDMKKELWKQVDEAGGKYDFLQQQSGASEEDYWNNTNQYKFDKETWAEKTYGGQFS